MRTIAVLVAAAALYVVPAHASPATDPSLPVSAAPADGSRSSANASLAGGREQQNITLAKRYLGGNPTGRRSLWCADFMNLVEKKAGRSGTGSRWARSYLDYGRKVSTPKPGDIVVLWRGSPRGRSGHVGYFMGHEDGKVLLISGNHGRKVGIGRYPKSRVLGYRRPS